MAGSGGAYSRVVASLKILLPLAGLALLSTLFLIARAPGTAPELPFSEVRSLAREQGITAPRLAGRSDDGALMVITARSARAAQGRPDVLGIQDIMLEMENPDGSTLTVDALEGELDGKTERARFLGLARVETSGGYEMETNDLEADLTSGTIRSNGAVEIQAPFGELTAGGMVFEEATDHGGAIMRFTSGVRLIYRPE